jgi:transcriptional regulator with XRE-family HTH domain
VDLTANTKLLKTFLIYSLPVQLIFVFLPKIDKIIFVKMKSLGETLRELRENKALPLRTIAAYLDIDQAILSRIERGQRKATREQVVKLAKYFNVDENDLLIAWLSDKVVYEVADEEIALQALRVAEEKVKYNTIQKV